MIGRFRRLVALAALGGLSLLFPAVGAEARPFAFSMEAISMDEEDPHRNRVGRLIWRGGFALTAAEKKFGGFSGLAISADGDVLTMVSDAGLWMRARPLLDGRGNFRGLESAAIGRLRGPDGSLLLRNHDRDAESVDILPDGLLVSFEQRHRLWLYRGRDNPLFYRPREIPAPSMLSRAHPNQGIEAIVRLADGKLVALAEGFPLGAGDLLGWVRNNDRPDGTWREFTYRRHRLYRPTGATLLPNGDVLLLERRFTWLGGFAARLATLKAADIKPGATLEARPLAEFDSAPLAENFEGLAAYRGPGGRTFVYMMSDDNFNILQRTLLVMFELVD